MSNVVKECIIEGSRVVRLSEITKLTGRSRSTIYLDIKNGLFPQLFRIGGRATGVLLNEIQSINFARAAGKSQQFIKALVLQLEDNRQSKEIV